VAASGDGTTSAKDAVMRSVIFALGAGALGIGCSVGLGEVVYRDGGAGGAGGATTSSSSTPTSTTSSTGTGGGPSCPTFPVNESFVGDAGALDPCWMQLDPSRFAQVGVDPGGQGLLLRPAPILHNGWYGAERGPLLFKRVRGPFVISAGVFASVAGHDDLPPAGEYNAAGILVRDPAAPSARWVLIDIGRQGADEGGVVGVVTKSTVGGATTKTLANDGNTSSVHAKLGICRNGGTFQVAYRKFGLPGGSDDPPHLGPAVEVWSNPPDELEVGLVATTWTATPDLVARVGSVSWDATPTGDCLADVMALP
jgi:hypothetical protein